MVVFPAMPSKTALRVPTSRVELIVDNNGNALIDTGVLYGLFQKPGIRGLFGNDQLLATRIVDALPLNKSHSVQVAPVELLRDNGGCYLADPNGNLIGVDGVFVHRMIYAERVWDMRRFG